ncbi:NAD(P)-binding protein [Auriculariales sp. MPI-PUGE-AT-0066]|nr:NAD(P)-binding protein [Auriculariales sp. MPI-PUGE-AT-0066]
MSLNFRDILAARNNYVTKLPAGIGPGSDPAGEVILVGPGAETRHSWRPRWELARNRGRRVFRASSLVPVPDTWTYEEAATLACAGVTAYNALLGGPKTFQPGQTVLLQGTGGVSVVAAQIARVSGARVILTSSSDEKLHRIAQRVGAHDTINYKTLPEWQNRVLEWPWCRLYPRYRRRRDDIALIEGGRNGTIAIIGGLSGWDISVNLFQIIAKAVNIRGIGVGDRHQHIALTQLFDLHKVKPVVAKVYTFGQAKEALKVLEEQDFVGKVVVKVSQN